MVSKDYENEQMDDGLPPIVSFGEMIKANENLENLCHELSETEPTFLVSGGNGLISSHLAIKQGISTDRIYDLDSIERGVDLKTDSDNVWKTFLQNRKDGLMVILYSNENGGQSAENKSNSMYQLMKGLGLTSVYIWNCDFGIPGFKSPTDKVSLENDLKKAYSDIHSASVGMDEFETRLEQTRNEPPISTGYKKLDEILDGGLPL